MKMSKSEKTKIKNSPAFKKWYKARKQTPNPPRTINKAIRWYTIDKNIDAKVEIPKVWAKHTNRADIPRVDKGSNIWNRKKIYRKKKR